MKTSAWEDGDLELYALGALSPSEALDIEHAAANDPSLAARLNALRGSLETLAVDNDQRPPIEIRQRLLQQFLQEREATCGEIPLLHSQSKPEDFGARLTDAMTIMAGHQKDFVCIPMGKTEDTHTYLVKMSKGIPPEEHHAEIERVLLLQGACDFQVGQQVHALHTGDQYTIPLHVSHFATTTSAQPCIFILQRTAIGS